MCRRRRETHSNYKVNYIVLAVNDADGMYKQIRPKAERNNGSLRVD